MAKYILSPKYNDMGVIILGSSVSAILKKFKKHWEDDLNDMSYTEDWKEEQWDKKESEYETEEDFMSDKIRFNGLKHFFAKDFKTPEEIADYYNEHFDEDYTMEEAD